MIYTLTLNPSIDYVMNIDTFIDGSTLRSHDEKKFAGGKGIMVSKLLKNLGEDPVNLGFLGGYTGEFIKDCLRDLEIKEDFTKISDDSRINVKLKYGKETEINAGGPEISNKEAKNLLDKIDNIDKDSILVISGSIPKSLDKDFYKDILDIINCDFTIDIAGKELLDYLKYKPLLVKPNIDELSEIFDIEINMDNIFSYARKLQQLGAKNVIVSMGKDGSIFLDEANQFIAKPVSGKLINSVGAGDSMVAGFVYGLKSGLTKKEAYSLAVACGSATAFSLDIGKKESIYEILEKVEVNENGN